MRSLVLAFTFGGLLFTSQLSFALDANQIKGLRGVDCASLVNGEHQESFNTRCGAIDAEFNRLSRGGYGTAATSDTDLETKIQNLDSRASQCCRPGNCDQVGTQPRQSGTGMPAQACYQASLFKFMGKNAAQGAGICDTVKAVCDDFVTQSQSAPGITPAKITDARQKCAAMDARNQRTIAKNQFTDFDTVNTSNVAQSTSNPAYQCPQANNNTPGNGPSPGAGGGGNGNGNGAGGGGGQADNGSATPDSKKKPSSGGMGQGLGQLAQMAGPMIQQMMAQQDQNQEQPKPPEIASVQCGPGVVHPSCPAQAAPENKTDPWKTGQGGFQTASKNAAFNPGDTGQTPGTGKPTLTASNDQQQHQGGQAAVVPNGGGGMPGGGGGNAAASLGGGGGGGGGSMQTASSKLPDANSLTSHGSSMANLNSSLSTAVGGGAGGPSGSGIRPGLGEEPINYADFLPKPGATGRALAGNNLRPIMQIQSKEVNIWNRISDHIKQRCSLGLLRDCVP